MKKLALILLLLFTQISVFASPVVFKGEDGFGLKDENGNIIVVPEYNKLIRLGESGWIIQDGTKFGVMSDDGRVTVKPKYTQAERVLGKYAKLRTGERWGLFDEMGFEILPVEYSSIDLLFGGMFLTCKNYKYGVTDMNGQPLLDNIFDDIYMPKPDTMIITYNGNTYEVSGIKNKEFILPGDVSIDKENSNIVITELISKPAVTTGYYGVTATNYLLKIFSSISPAYEETIDELMFSQGADAATVIMKFSWLPKFPFVYAKKYYKNLTAPNNGPLSGVKSNLKRELTE